MTIEDRLNTIQIDEEIFQKNYVNLSRTYSYLLDTYKFAKRVDERDSEIDGLHRYLFEDTKYTVESYEFPVGRLGKSSLEYFSELLQEQIVYPEIQTEVVTRAEDIPRDYFVESEPYRVATEAISLSESDLSEGELYRREDILRDAYEKLSRYFTPTDIHTHITEIGMSRMLKSSVSCMRNSRSLYERRLATEGFIDREGGTPSLAQIVGASLILSANVMSLLRAIWNYVRRQRSPKTNKKQENEGAVILDKIQAAFLCIGAVLLAGVLS
jgi:hypothetical protein